MDAPLALGGAGADDQDGREAARHATHQLQQLLSGDDRVNGVGITWWQSRYAVRVTVVEEADAPDLPQEVDGVPVTVVRSGPATAQRGDLAAE